MPLLRKRKWGPGSNISVCFVAVLYVASVIRSNDKTGLHCHGSATVTFTVNGKQIGRSVPATFTASETFDIGIDLGSPVSLNYHEQAPFKFNGKIDKIKLQYFVAERPSI